MGSVFRGLEKHQEQKSSALIRDTRTIGQRIADFFKNPEAVFIYMLSLSVCCIFMNVFCDIILLIALISFFYAYHKKNSLPFRLPARCKKPDYNDLNSISQKPNVARGIYFIGNDMRTSEELWLSNDDMRTHMLIFGSTGSGKTEALISLALNALIQGSGFIYVDGKGDNSLFAKVFSMCRRMGREDDFLLINFMTGARDIVGPQEKRLSNTMNPFSHGSSSMLSQLVISLMESSKSGSSDGDMWKGRAINFVEALMRILVYMRDLGHILLDANTIRNYFTLDKLEPMLDKVFLREGLESIYLHDVPDSILDPIKNYVINLPGYDRGRKGKQVSQVIEQHGYITMQLTRVFGSLSDTYGHILRTNLPEVDLRDVVLNRRIMVVLLPALEKSPDELSNLGKVIIASLKSMMASGLGDEVEGSYRDVIQKKPTNSPTPYLCILDEYGYYAVPGFAVVPAQARSLGFSVVFAGQDLPAFQKASKEEAASIGANTNIKICMKLEDPTDTWEFFMKMAGEAFVTKVDSFQISTDNVAGTYNDARSASAEKRQRIDLLDLKDQQPGEAHIFFRSALVRANVFYAAPPMVRFMKLNHFMKVEPVPMSKLIDLDRAAKRADKIIETGNFGISHFEDEVSTLTDYMKEYQGLKMFESCVASLLGMRAHKGVAFVNEPEQTADVLGDIFMRMNLKPDLRKFVILGSRDEEQFCSSPVHKNIARDAMFLVERFSEHSESHAVRVVLEILKDLSTSTQYPHHDLTSYVYSKQSLLVSLSSLTQCLKNY